MKIRMSIILLASIIFNLNFIMGQQKIKDNEDYLFTIKTKYGEMKLVLFDKTPKHRDNFIKLVSDKFYDSTTFHRVINKFMIQGGDPNTKPGGRNDMAGMGNVGYMIDAEFVPEYTHVKGALAAARTNNPQKRSSGCQFYIVQNDDGTHFLDKEYTVFGQVISGFDVIDKISLVPKGPNDKPLENVYMTITYEILPKSKIEKMYNYDYNNPQKVDYKK